MGRRGTIEEMAKIAESRGGKCLSRTYINNRVKLEWVCSQGHTWFAIPHNVKQGSWCPICSRKEGQRYKRLTIEEMQAIAQSRGGICLSNEYVDNKTKLKWRCKDGHEWESAPNNIKSGSWCPYCTKYKAEERCRYIFESLLSKEFKKTRKVINGFELDGFNRELMLAFEYHGKQHYEYVPFFHRSIESFNKRIQRDLEKERLCEKQGIRLITIPHNVANSDSELIKFIKSKLTEYKVPLVKDNVDLSNYYKSLSILIELKRLAEKRGGKLLSNYYINSENKLKWQCEQKHVWYTTPTVIKGGHWCPVCSGNTKLSMEELRQIARSHGGKCLTNEYVNSHTKMKWQCAKEHIWETTGGTIKAGTWCPRCAATKRNKKFKLSIDEMHKIAATHEGKCLSEKYINSKTKLKWMCKKGHVFLADPTHVKRGQWCRKCSYIIRGESRKLSISEMHEIAKRRGGKCLSNEYLGTDIKLKWKCSNGHIWEATPHTVNGKSKSWCPYCANKQRGEHKKLTIEVLREIAAEKGGRCLSTEYVNANTKVRWQCAYGHEWEAKPSSVKNNGTWCRKCYNLRRRGILN